MDPLAMVAMEIISLATSQYITKEAIFKLNLA